MTKAITILPVFVAMIAKAETARGVDKAAVREIAESLSASFGEKLLAIASDMEQAAAYVDQFFAVASGQKDAADVKAKLTPGIKEAVMAALRPVASRKAAEMARCALA